MMFQERFRNEGGKFFDASTMKATVNGPAGVKVFQDWVAENKWMPPGVETWDFGKNLSAFLVGDTAMTISWPPYGRWAAGYGTEEKALSWVPKTQIAGKVGYAMPPGGHPQLAAGFALSISSNSKKKVAGLPVHPVAEQQRHQHRAGAAALCAARSVPRQPLHLRGVQEPLAGGAAISGGAQAGAVNGLLDLSIIQTDKYEEALRQGISKLWAGEDPQGDPRPGRGAVGRADRPHRRRQAARGLRGVGRQAQRLPDRVVSRDTAPALAGGRLSQFADRQFKYLAITPAVVIILLIGLFPIVYSAVVSFQNINMLEEDTSFSGLLNYQRLIADTRFWLALGHTFVFLAIALPIELILGLLLAYLFLDRMPGPADLRGAAGAAGGDLADRQRRHVVDPVRQPLRADQPDPGLDRRAAR